MRPTRFAVLLLGSNVLVQVQIAFSFSPHRIIRTYHDGLKLESTPDDATDRYLARVRQFEALTEEAFAHQKVEIDSILDSIRIIEERVEAREAQMTPRVPPPPPPPPTESYAPPPPPPPPISELPPPPVMEVPNSDSAVEYEMQNGALPPDSINGYENGLNGASADAMEPVNGYHNGHANGANGVEVLDTFSNVMLPNFEEDNSLNGEGAESLPSTSSLLAGTTFQLEEMEDRDGCSTEIILEPNHTVTVGLTDGPLFTSATGTWLALPDRLDMVITRQFDAGQKARNYTDLGEFSFAVERTYWGEVTKVGERLAVAGTIHCSDELLGIQDLEVGYFNMIDTREYEEEGDELPKFRSARVS